MNFLLPLLVVFAFPAVGTRLAFPHLANYHLLVFGVFGVLFAATLIWQLTGVFRSVDSFLVSGGDRSWGAVIQGLALVTLLYAIAVLVTEYQTLKSDHQRYLALSEPDKSPGYSLYSLEEGRRVLIRGSLEIGATRSLKDYLDRYPLVSTVELDSDGGRVYEGRGLFKLIRDRALNTHVTTRCYSACALAFLGGRKRTLAESGVIGFHQYRSYTAQVNVDPEREQEKDIALIQQQGLSELFARKVFSIGPDSIWIPGRDELVKFKVISE